MNALSFSLNPVAAGADLGVKAGAVLANKILNPGTSASQSLAQVLANPQAPVVINNPPKQGLDALGIGFFEKNLIIVGVVALGAVAIWRTIK